MKKIFSLLLCAVFLFLIGCSSSKAPEKTDISSIDTTSGLHHATISVKDFGTIELELDADAAPITVANFISLASSGFYDGLTFHRIQEGFMMQGGDPEGNGTGGSYTKIKGEFAANGVSNPISHKRGVISMARAKQNDSASSQFFIVQKDSEYLDGDYAVFGYVTSGMDIVDKIAEDAKPIDNNGSIKYEEQPVLTSIKVVK
jgi:peptidyl-prolyl cis-trans isomerase B (cyclophilin B)